MERVIPKKFISFFEMHDWDALALYDESYCSYAALEKYKNIKRLHRKRGKFPWAPKSHNNVIFPPNSHAFKHFTGDSYDFFLFPKWCEKQLSIYGVGILYKIPYLFFYVLQRDLNKLPFTWAYGWTWHSAEKQGTTPPATSISLERRLECVHSASCLHVDA